MHKLRTVTSLDVSAVAGHHAMPAALLFISFLDFMSRITVIWITSPEVSYVCHTYAMPICAPMWAENS